MQLGVDHIEFWNPNLKKFVNIINLNYVDENPDSTEKYGEQVIPYVAVYVKGEKDYQFTGNKQDKLIEAIEITKK